MVLRQKMRLHAKTGKQINETIVLFDSAIERRFFRVIKVLPLFVYGAFGNERISRMFD